ncbi:hypothetical protein VP01_251g5 [Puccinia sorghi]|uniref:Uncharacterized protein n=1 Tax=Puccinia sorghi TaxID=27349 RepID=A0A0L6V5I7_9BASI|nr:hypothetical protein VP01_251g5 [Puccinia sorghi]
MPKKTTPKPTKPNKKKPAIQRKSKKNRVNDSSEDDAADKTTGHLKKCDNLLLWNWEGSCYQPNPLQMKDKFNNYKDMHKKFHTKSILMGFGLTNENQKAGISTVNEKLESMCPHYHVMNELMHKLTTKPQHHPLLSPNKFLSDPKQ